MCNDNWWPFWTLGPCPRSRIQFQVRRDQYVVFMSKHFVNPPCPIRTIWNVRTVISHSFSCPASRQTALFKPEAVRFAMALTAELTSFAARVFWIFTIILCESWSRSTQTCKYILFCTTYKNFKTPSVLVFEKTDFVLVARLMPHYNKWNQQMLFSHSGIMIVDFVSLQSSISELAF